MAKVRLNKKENNTQTKRQDKTNKEENKTPVTEEQKAMTNDNEQVTIVKDENTNKVEDNKEVKQEETETTPVKPIKYRTIKSNMIAKVFKDITLEEAIEEGKKYPNLKDIAETFDRYIKNFNMKDGVLTARLNYGIYSVMKTTIEKDYNEFLPRFRFINMLICKGKTDKLNSVRLLSHDFNWKWGGTEFRRFSYLVTALTAKCEYGNKRLENVISISKLVKKFTGRTAENLQKYFTA